MSETSQFTDRSEEMLDPLPKGETYRFACHQGVRCFTDCCRDLHLVLTPYDVLRVKRGLVMDSTAFRMTSFAWGRFVFKSMAYIRFTSSMTAEMAVLK